MKQIPSFGSACRRSAIFVALAATLALAGPALAQEATTAPGVDPDAVIGTVNGKTITNRDIGFAIGDLQEQLGQVPPQQQRFAALMALVDIRLLASSAEAAGIGETEAFRQRLDFLRDRALHNSYFAEQVIDTITDEQVRAMYDSEIASRPPENELRARHILVETEQEARDIIGELQAGADFAALAQERSTGPSGPQGGDLGYFGRGRMVPAFEQAAFATETGSFTAEPVQTNFGWHVILVEDRRPIQPPPFDQVAQRLQSLMIQERYFELLGNLRTEAAVDITDPDLRAAYDAAVAQQVGAPQPPAAQ